MVFYLDHESNRVSNSGLAVNVNQTAESAMKVLR